MFVRDVRAKKHALVLLGIASAIGLAGCVVTPEPIPLFDGALAGGDSGQIKPDLDREGPDAFTAPDLDYVPEDAAVSIRDAPSPDGWALVDGPTPDGLGDGQPDGLLEDVGPKDGGPSEGGVTDAGPAPDGPAGDMLWED